MSKKLSFGKSVSVPAYYEGQKASGTPNHYVVPAEAERLRRTGKARSINHGTAILIRGPRRPGTATRDSVKRAWKVTGQTAKKKPQGPGFPHYSSV